MRLTYANDIIDGSGMRWQRAFGTRDVAAETSPIIEFRSLQTGVHGAMGHIGWEPTRLGTQGSGATLY